MRIIAGKYKGIRLTSPKDETVRPTTDRIKETVFNILVSRYSVENTDVLDLFCGSGALGLEAASRGAKSVVFADASADSIKLTKENIAKTKSDFEVIRGDFRSTVKKLRGRKFGIVFVDPPYKAGFYDEVIAAISDYELLDDGGVIVAECDGDADLIKYGEIFDADIRKFGNTKVGFYSVKER